MLKNNLLIVLLLISAFVFYACESPSVSYEEISNKSKQIVGNDSDSHGCKASAGYSWCEAKQKCLRSWEEPCIERVYENIDLSKISVTKNQYAPNYIASTTYQGINYEFPLRYKPEELASIKIETGIINLIKDKVYMTKDPGLTKATSGDSTIASIEAGDVIAKAYKKNVQSALTQKVDKTIPKKTCSDVSADTTIVYTRLGNENQVYKENNCIIIEGKDGKGMIMAAEKFAYYLISKL